MSGYTPQMITRFWSKVNKNGPVPTHDPTLGPCWIWIAGIRSNGYGLFWRQGKQVSAHRVSWEINKGSIPEGMKILHHCDNRACANPSHLRPGTHLENMADRTERGRTARMGGPVLQGETNYAAKLTNQQAQEILTKYTNGKATQIQLAHEYGVSQSAISLITARKKWKHLTP